MTFVEDEFLGEGVTRGLVRLLLFNEMSSPSSSIFSEKCELASWP